MSYGKSNRQTYAGYYKPHRGNPREIRIARERRFFKQIIAHSHNVSRRARSVKLEKVELRRENRRKAYYKQRLERRINHRQRDMKKFLHKRNAVKLRRFYGRLRNGRHRVEIDYHTRTESVPVPEHNERYKPRFGVA